MLQLGEAQVQVGRQPCGSGTARPTKPFSMEEKSPPSTPTHGRGEKVQKMLERHRWRPFELQGLELHCFRAEGEVWAVLPLRHLLLDWLKAFYGVEK